MILSSRKGRWREKPAPFIFFNLVFCLVLSDVALATVLQKLSIEQLALEADIIVRGRIQKISSEETRDHSNITTLVEVAVTEQWKGPKASKLILSQPGGSAGGITQAVPGAAHFSPRQEVILFLKATKGGRFITIGGSQGKFTIKTDYQNRKEIVEDLTGKSRPLDDFLIDLKSILK